MWSEECGVWSENSTEIQYSYTKSLVLETYLTPHSTFLIPHSTFHIPHSTLHILLLSRLTKGERLDIGFYNRFTFSAKHATDGIFEFVVFNAERLLCCSQENHVR